MKTGMEIITEIGECSSQIAELSRFITSHGMANSAYKAELERLDLVQRRDELRTQLETLPDLSFT